jgi:hypothetical protein
MTNLEAGVHGVHGFGFDFVVMPAVHPVFLLIADVLHPALIQ